MEKLANINALRELRTRLEKETFSPDTPRIRACAGTACTASGAHKVIDAITGEAKRKGVDVDVVKTGCQGLCQKGPVMVVERDAASDCWPAARSS